MKRLRHPNVLLFMGAVTSAQRLCIVTEFLPRFILNFSFQNTILQILCFIFFVFKNDVCAEGYFLYIYILSMQWKFISLTAKEYIQTRLETACSYGFGYSEF